MESTGSFALGRIDRLAHANAVHHAGGCHEPFFGGRVECQSSYNLSRGTILVEAAGVGG